MNKPEINEAEPKAKHSKFLLNDNSTVFIDFPPYDHCKLNFVENVPKADIFLSGS